MMKKSSVLIKIMAVVAVVLSGCTLDDVKDKGDKCPPKGADSELEYIQTSSQMVLKGGSGYLDSFTDQVCPFDVSGCSLDTDKKYYCMAKCDKNQVGCNGKCIDPATDMTYCGATKGESYVQECLNYKTCHSWQVCKNSECIDLNCQNDDMRCINGRIEVCSNSVWEKLRDCSSSQCENDFRCAIDENKCEENEHRCSGNSYETCTEGTWKKTQACAENETCDKDNGCIKKGSDIYRCTENVYEVFEDGEWKMSKVCAEDESCNPDAGCVKKSSEAEHQCKDNEYQVNKNGEWIKEKVCSKDELCMDDKGCVKISSTAEHRCNGKNYEVNVDNKWGVLKTCSDDEVCDEENGCVTSGEGCTATFVYENLYTSANANGSMDFDVYLIGNFNDWSIADIRYKMTPDGKGVHTITILVTPGIKITYKYYIDGWENDSYKLDPYENVDNDGNSVVEITQCGQTFGLKKDNPETDNDRPHCYLNAMPKYANQKLSFDIKCDDNTKTITAVIGGVAPSVVSKSVVDTITADGKYYYYVHLGNEVVFVPVWVESKLFDWHNAYIYRLITDRFKDGDSSNNAPATDATVLGTANARWLGGDFKGIQKKVEEGYFDVLGVNVLWISSVSKNYQSIEWGDGNNEKYSYSAYYSNRPIGTFVTDDNALDFIKKGIEVIEPHFGTDDDLIALVNACHKRGIRVMVDLIANHVHKDSPIFKEHPDWFYNPVRPDYCDVSFSSGRSPETCSFLDNTAMIDYRNENARKAMINHVKWLIQKFNIDGINVYGAADVDTRFLKDLRSTVDQIYYNTGSMFYLAAELFDNDKSVNEYIGSNLLHAADDYHYYHQIWESVFQKLSYVFFVTDGPRYNTDVMMSYIGSPLLPRPLSRAAIQKDSEWISNIEVTDFEPYFKTKIAMTLVLMNPGIPVMYYGDEYGQEGAGIPDNRRMMKFDNFNSEQSMMLSFSKMLGQIHKKYADVIRGERVLLDASESHYCYKLTDGNKTLIIGVSNYTGGVSDHCFLGKKYTLKNIMTNVNETITTDDLDLSDTKLQYYEVQ